MQSDFMFNFKAVGPETMAAQDDKSVLEALAHHKIFVKHIFFLNIDFKSKEKSLREKQ